MPEFTVQPTARLGDWLIDAFAPSELSGFLKRWGETGVVLKGVAYEGATPEGFVGSVVEQLRKLGLLGLELFVHLARERPLRVDTFVLAVAGFAEVEGTGPRLTLVHAAKEAALRDGAISQFIARLQRLKEEMPDLRDELVLEITTLERVGKAAPPVAAEVFAVPAAVANDSPAAALGSREEHRERIEQAIVMDDLDTARRRLSTYLEEYQGLMKARATERELGEEPYCSQPDALRRQILAILKSSYVEESKEADSRKEAAPGAVVLSCQDLEKSYHVRGVRVYHLHCPPLELRLGEVVGVVGPNAGGKSTLLRILAGRLATESGNLRYPHFEGHGRGGEISWERVHRGIHFVPQRPPRWRERMICELRIHAARCGLRGEQNEDRVAHVCNRLGLDGHLQHRWEELSGGLRLRFELARALLSPADLLIFDEPLAPLDVNAQAILLEDLRIASRSAKQPRAIVLSSQHIWEVEQVADRMLFLEGGVVKQRRPATLRCLELAGVFTPAFVDRIRRLGAVRWTNSLQQELLLETDLMDLGLVHAELAKAAHHLNTRLTSVRDVSESVLRTLRRPRESQHQ